ANDGYCLAPPDRFNRTLTLLSRKRELLHRAGTLLRRKGSLLRYERSLCSDSTTKGGIVAAKHIRVLMTSNAQPMRIYCVGALFSRLAFRTVEIVTTLLDKCLPLGRIGLTD